MQREEKNEIHIVMFPWHAFGHISPFIQLSNKLSNHGRLQISFFSASGNIPRIKSSLNLLPNVQIIPLSIPHVPGLPPDLHNTSQMTPAMAELLKQASDLMQSQIHDTLSRLKPHFIFFDLLQEWTPKIASSLGIKTICFSVFSAIGCAYLTVPARQNKLTVDDLTKPPDGFPATSVTGVQRFQARDFCYVFKSFDGLPAVYYRVIDCFRSCDATAIKTCKEMEGPYVDFVETQFQKPLLLIGPLVPDPQPGVLEEKWAKWLRQFPDKSVVFCSFGSETFMNQEQIREIALGLELTGSPFLLVLNFPGGVDGQAELEKALPEGFMERVKSKGAVHIGWIQQQLILAHDSVGCYVCHSGFSSVMEGLMNDCRLVLLPFKGDQFLNSKLIGLDLKAGVEVNREEDEGYFGKEDIYEAIKTAMADDGSIKENHEKWREFLLNEEIHKKFVVDLVEKLKTMLLI